MIEALKYFTKVKAGFRARPIILPAMELAELGK